MKKSDFYYDLPESLIAQYPLQERSSSRLLTVNRQQQSFADGAFQDIYQILQPGDLLVLNNTKVIPARLYGKKETGGKIELLLERQHDAQSVLCFIRASKAPKPKTKLYFGDIEAEVIGRDSEYFIVRFIDTKDPVEIFNRQGHIPLPPYIERDDTLDDQQRYQTVFAENEGAVAAPTAGLHFDHELLTSLKEKGINIAKVTLHVGSGTFQPVREDDVSRHKMHKEWLSVSAQTADLVNQTRANGGKVYAVGTTVVRSLETASREGICYPFHGDTAIFIKPGYQFNVIDALITNFHLPESTLMMLVSALAGHELIMKAYQHAIQKKYRFFSYGDAMLII